MISKLVCPTSLRSHREFQKSLSALDQPAMTSYSPRGHPSASSCYVFSYGTSFETISATENSMHMKVSLYGILMLLFAVSNSSFAAIYTEFIVKKNFHVSMASLVVSTNLIAISDSCQ